MKKKFLHFFEPKWNALCITVKQREVGFMVLLHISVFFCKWWKIAALFSFIHKYKKLHLYAFNECWSGFLLEERNLWLKVCFDAAGQISLSTLLIESLDIPQGYFLFKLFQKCVCVKIVVWTHTSFHYISSLQVSY